MGQQTKASLPSRGEEDKFRIFDLGDEGDVYESVLEDIDALEEEEGKDGLEIRKAQAVRPIVESSVSGEEELAKLKAKWDKEDKVFEKKHKKRLIIGTLASMVAQYALRNKLEPGTNIPGTWADAMEKKWSEYKGEQQEEKQNLMDLMNIRRQDESDAMVREDRRKAAEKEKALTGYASALGENLLQENRQTQDPFGTMQYTTPQRQSAIDLLSQLGDFPVIGGALKKPAEYLAGQVREGISSAEDIRSALSTQESLIRSAAATGDPNVLSQAALVLGIQNKAQRESYEAGKEEQALDITAKKQLVESNAFTFEENKKKAAQGDLNGQAFMGLMQSKGDLNTLNDYPPEVQMQALQDWQTYKHNEKQISIMGQRTGPKQSATNDIWGIFKLTTEGEYKSFTGAGVAAIKSRDKAGFKRWLNNVKLPGGRKPSPELLVDLASSVLANTPDELTPKAMYRRVARMLPTKRDKKGNRYKYYMDAIGNEVEFYGDSYENIEFQAYAEELATENGWSNYGEKWYVPNELAKEFNAAPESFVSGYSGGGGAGADVGGEPPQFSKIEVEYAGLDLMKRGERPDEEDMELLKYYGWDTWEQFVEEYSKSQQEATGSDFDTDMQYFVSKLIRYPRWFVQADMNSVINGDESKIDFYRARFGKTLDKLAEASGYDERTLVKMIFERFKQQVPVKNKTWEKFIDRIF